jgi:hypothetical protein
MISNVMFYLNKCLCTKWRERLNKNNLILFYSCIVTVFLIFVDAQSVEGLHIFYSEAVYLQFPQNNLSLYAETDVLNLCKNNFDLISVPR